VACLGCPSFDKDREICLKKPSEVKDPVCLGRIQCWFLCLILQELQDESDDRQEGDWWKEDA